MKKVIKFKPKGMNRDLSKANFSPEFSYENKNIRFTTNEANSLMSITNERGPEEVSRITKAVGNRTILGYSTLEDNIILFCKGENEETPDHIIVINDTEIKDFAGNLNFNVEYPIEAISIYENENTQKVYWTDGLNSPRVINIGKNNSSVISINDVSFTPNITKGEVVSIENDFNISGAFPSGTIQYAFSYINKAGVESNLFYVSPLYYTAFKNRGANPEDLVNTAFKISLFKIDTSFKYVRVYSILRTSENNIPLCKRVADIYVEDAKEQKLSRAFKASVLTEEYFGMPELKEDKSTWNFTITGTRDGEDKTTWHLYDFQSSPEVLKGGIQIHLNCGDVSPIFTSIDKIEWKSSGGKSYSFTPDNTSKYTFILNMNGATSDSPEQKGIVIAKLEILKYGEKENIYVPVPTEVDINENYEGVNLLYTDPGTIGDSIDPTELLYIGGEEIIAQTISHKDNTLFLGNIKKDSTSYINLDFESSGGTRPPITFTADKRLPSPEYTGYYAYKNNLDKSNWEITTFKYNEWYRFGLQAQSKNGKWSEPVWINDCRNTTSVKNAGDTPYLVTASFKLVKDKVNELIEQGYIKVRPVIVYPSIHDRECICQGVVCPTVYNIGDRKTNSPWVQASWVFRPESSEKFTYPEEPVEPYVKGVPMFFPYAYQHDQGIGGFKINDYASLKKEKRLWKHYIAAQEIQGVIYTPPFPQINKEALTSYPLDDEYFFVDRSVLTLNSPDIEFNDNVQTLDLSNVKFRIVGEIPIHANNTQMAVSTSTPGIYLDRNPNTGSGLKPIPNTKYFNSSNPLGGFQAGFLWNDWIAYYGEDKYNLGNHIVYMWHREGSLNNTNSVHTSDPAARTSVLQKKNLSILRSSKYTDYYASREGDYTTKIHTFDSGISEAVLYNNTELGMATLAKPKNSNLNNLVYYGNVDKIVNITTNKRKRVYYDVDNKENKLQTVDEANASKAGGYASLVATVYENDDQITYFDSDAVTDYIKDPTHIKYKSAPHIVFALNSTDDGKVNILPYRRSDVGKHPGNLGLIGEYVTPYDPWNKELTKEVNVVQKTITGNTEYDILWIGELYRDNISNRFGGTSEEALQNNSWLPCGESVELVKDVNITLKWIGGDTFYQRYDCMKTYPFTFEDRNQLTDILSFMCETRVNIDGRYDRNRGILTNFAVSPANFNLINPVYTQQDNFFNYRIISDKDNRITDFPSTITWSKTKTVGEKVDTWTNITLASTLDLDGDKGPITSLQRFNDQLIAFQDKGISQILYNENMQVSTESGVPIEIANSGKVNGKRYLSNNVGCQNKWSICSTPSGIYFIDNLNKSINLFAGEVIDLSKKHGFNSWINSTSKLTKWNPKDFSNFVTFYDNKNKDVLFINNDTCLAYSELLGQFTSFYDYNRVFPVINNLGNTYLGRDSKIYLHNEGQYNYFFDEYKPFYIEVIANENPTVDKIFTNIEFTSDTWNNTTLTGNTFDTLTVHNEYQQGSIDLSFIKNKPSPLKRKFRIWRADIPRDSVNKRDRMRNTWLNLKLEKSNTDNNNDKTVLHDLSVYYHI